VSSPRHYEGEEPQGRFSSEEQGALLRAGKVIGWLSVATGFLALLCLFILVARWLLRLCGLVL
jgi:hypothetical protein